MSPAGSDGTTAAPMVVEVRLFAILRERAGRDSILLTLAAGATVAEALAALERVPGLDGVLGRLPVRLAVNRDYAAADTVLEQGDELALIPPLSGGAGEQTAVATHVRVTEQRLSLERLNTLVSDPRAGAIVCFQGVTREVERLDYEAYTAMAQERIEQILRECVAAHGLLAAAAEHRVGSVPLGEPSVIVAVSAAHRAEAFAGAREAIDRIKAEAPIWKREHALGSPGRWVPGTVPPP